MNESIINIMSAMGAESATHANGAHSLALKGDYDNSPWATMVALKINADGSREWRIHSASEDTVVEVTAEAGEALAKAWPASWEEIEGICCDAAMKAPNEAIKRVIR